MANLHPFAYNENLLFFLRKNLSLRLKLAIYYFVMWHDWQNDGLDRKLLWNVQKMYISPKPLNLST